MKAVMTFFADARPKVHVKVVNVEEDDASAIERDWTFEIERSGAARRGKLALFIAAGGDLFECLELAWLAVDAQLKISAFSPLTNFPCLSKTITSVWTSSV
jgi:hypothetical protein